MRFLEDNGLRIFNGSSIAIDCAKPKDGELAVITHAHSAHIFSGKSFNGSVLASHETLELLNGRLGSAKPVGKRFSEKAEFEGSEISLESSCHVLGSAQVIIEGEKKVVVTSDFQLQESLMLPKAQVHSADILVIESTFGLPEFEFPKRERIYGEIGKWVEANAGDGKFTLLAGYSLGKAQELCKILSQYSQQVPLVHEKVFEFNKKYESLGVKLGGFELLNHNLKDFNVAILPPHIVSKELLQALHFSTGRKVVAGIATGWQSYNNAFSKIFPLSDHADFEQLVHYVKESGAKKVFTMHGFAREFAKHLNRKLGVQARPLDSK